MYICMYIYYIYPIISECSFNIMHAHITSYIVYATITVTTKESLHSYMFHNIQLMVMFLHT